MIPIGSQELVSTSEDWWPFLGGRDHFRDALAALVPFPSPTPASWYESVVKAKNKKRTLVRAPVCPSLIVVACTAGKS